jgi:hypothetical protein
MKKIIFSLTLLIFGLPLLVESQEVKVTNNIPGLCKSGDRCIVEITIEKGAVEGFARIQQTLPDGIRAELVSDGGSDFTFDKQSVRFIWLSVPATPVIKVSYRLTFDAGLSGTYSIGEGVFSCLVDNKIQKFTLTPVMVEVNPKPVAVAPKAEPKPETKVEPVAAAKEPVAEVAIPTQEVPAGGIFKAENQEKPLVEAKPATKEEQGEVKLIETVVRQAAHPEAKAEPVSKPVRPDSLAILPAERQVQKKPVEEPVANPQSGDSEVTEQPVSGAEVTYAIQFAALKSFKEPVELKKQYRISEEVRCESADGWHRYSFGAWRTQAEAEAVRKSFSDRTGQSAFVVKMKNGKRIQ